MKTIALILLMSATLRAQSAEDRTSLVIENSTNGIPTRMTHYNVGPETGSILNAHFFPAILYYSAGRYLDAEDNLSYVIDRPYYIEQNPRRREFLSTAYYMRGMIYFHHASGPGKLALAKADFESALAQNPNNFEVYMELSRVLVSVGAKPDAVSVLNRLLERKPEQSIAVEARAELEKLNETK